MNDEMAWHHDLRFGNGIGSARGGEDYAGVT